MPPEILENVLACLPVHVLCQLRLVCKSWNDLITHPGFASLCAQAPRQTPYVLITPKLSDFNKFRKETRRDWEILDMAERRFYSLSDSFIADHLSRSEEFKFGWCKSTLAADGGLIYACYQGGNGVREQDRRHIVCNPVSKDFHQITEPKPHRFDRNDIVVMSVDSATKSYRIIIMESYTSRSRREQAYLYNSVTMQWRTLCEVPDINYRAYSSIFMDGNFFTLFLEWPHVPLELWCPKLYSCDTGTGAWSYIDVEMPRQFCRTDSLQLVVCLGRLFLVEYSGLPSTFLPSRRIMFTEKKGKIKFPFKVSIWEILLAKKEMVKVAEVSRGFIDEQPQTVVGNVIAVGCRAQ